LTLVQYWAIPRGAVSRDGKYLVFDSYFDISKSGLANYTDVHLVIQLETRWRRTLMESF